MKNLQQIQLVIKKLEHDKRLQQMEIKKLNMLIENKMAAVKKMLAYQADYVTSTQYVLTRSTPILIKNMQRFSERINDIIDYTRNEVATLSVKRNTYLEKLAKLSEKIKTMEFFAERAVRVIKSREANVSQNAMDDLIAAREQRS